MDKIKKDYIVIWLATIFCLIFVYFASKAHAEETKLMDGTIWRRIETSQHTIDLEIGNKIKMQVNSEWIYVQRLKASEYIPPGEILPLQNTEDNGDGNTDYVIIRIDTRERIAKDIKPKDSILATDTIDYE